MSAGEPPPQPLAERAPVDAARGRGKLRDYLDLVRIFLAPSAPLDSLAGLSLGLAKRDGALEPWRIALVVASSVSLYSFGMAANDIFDRRKDSAAAPARPLPSGRLSLAQAVRAACACAALGLACAAFAGAALPAAAIVVLVLAYDAGGKRIPVAGSLLMGACRSANLILGWTAAAGGSGAAALGDGAAVIAAAVIGVYVAGITSVSVLEDRPYRAWELHCRASLLLAVPLILGALEPHRAIVWAHVIAVLWLLIGAQRRAASRRLPAHPAQVHVRAALGTLFLIDAGLVWTLGPDPRAAAPLALIYALAALGWWSKRRWIQSGGADT